jgi:hypothetical protein
MTEKEVRLETQVQWKERPADVVLNKVNSTEAIFMKPVPAEPYAAANAARRVYHDV